MAIFSGKSRESEGVTNGVGAWRGLAMITDDYTSDAGIIIVAVLVNCECNLTRLKRDAFIAFVLHGLGLARPNTRGIKMS